jgi:hypothetical protein
MTMCHWFLNFWAAWSKIDASTASMKTRMKTRHPSMSLVDFLRGPLSTSHWTLENRRKSEIYIIHVLGGFGFLSYSRVPLTVLMVKIDASEHLKRVIGRIFFE